MAGLQTAQDQELEETVAGILADAWKCTLHAWPQFAKLDWYLSRGDRLIAFAELKGKRQPHDKYPHAYLDFDKWHALYEMSVICDCGGLALFGFDDGIYWSDVRQVDPTRTVVSGRRDRGIASDVHPTILVDVSALQKIQAVK